MNTPPRGLGRGLGALIPTRPTAPAHTYAPGAGTARTADGAELERDSTGPQNRPAKDGAAASESAVNAQSEQAVFTRRSLSEGADDLDSAFAEDSTALVAAGAYFAELPLGSISPNPRQPRSVFDEESLAELVSSIQVVGLLQPVVVREVSPGAFELVMGERRWRACQQAGLAEIPAIVRETADHDLLRDALLENLHRAELNPLEEAGAYRQLLDDFGCTHDELAGRIGRSRPQISNTLRLLRLSLPVQRRVAAGVLSAGHARALLAVENTAAQDALAARAVAEGMSVRTLEEHVAIGSNGQRRHSPRGVPKPTAPALVEAANRLSERLDTRCGVDLGQRKGKITVEFSSLDDLQRILNLMDPVGRESRLVTLSI